MLEQIIDHVSLRNRLLMVLLATAVIAGGAFSYVGLPVDAFPDVSPCLVQVFTVTEGLAPEEVERYITFPVETKMTGLPKVRNIRSISNFGLSVVSVYFEDDTDIYFARQVVAEALQEAREEIPEGFGDPQMGPIATGQGQVLYYYLRDTTGRYSLTELRTMQDWIVKYNLQTVSGVTEVLGIGGFEKQYQVIVQPDALLRYDVTLHEVIERIASNSSNVGAQFIERMGEQLVVRSEGLAEDVEDLEQIVIKAVDGSPVFLRDVAAVKIGGAIRRGLQTRNGVEEVVAGMAIKLIGTNSSTVIKDVEAKLREIQLALPEGVEIVPFYEQKSVVDASVRTVLRALLLGIGLVALVLLGFMGRVRPSLVVAAAIPFSVMFAFIAMAKLGISANLMSLGGLAIAIGMMVDGTVVMVENIDRHLRQADPSAPRLEIVARACREVARPVVFAISIIIIVFLPLFMLQGVEGKTFRPLASTVALAMIGSLAFALLLAPVLAFYLLGSSRGRTGDDPWIMRRATAWYRPVITLFVRRPVLALASALLLLAVGAVLYPRLGSEFTPRLDEGDIMVNLTMAPSASLTESKRVVMLIERRFLDIPEVVEVVSRIGRGEVGAHSAPVNVSHMNVVLKPEAEWRKGIRQPEIEAQLRERLRGFPGVLANVTQPIQLTVDELIGGVKAELAIKIFGEELPPLKASADEVAAIVRRIDGAADVQVEQMTGAPQLVIRPRRDALSRHGVNLATVQDVLRAAVGGVTAGQVFEGIRRFDVYVRFPFDARNTTEAIAKILIPTPEGPSLPLSQLATLEEVSGPRQIFREDGQRYISVQCNVVGRDIGSFVDEARSRIAGEVELPSGYFIAWGGQLELQQAANRRMAVVVPVTLALISLMLFMSFGSLKSAALILLNIPLALVGGVVALWISGQNLSVPASVGFIALFGIALENGMVLVTYLNQLVGQGEPVARAAVEGAILRLRPVMMTAVTTALGLVPLLLSSGTGSEVQRPLATVVFGGLATSTVLTLLVVPAIYRWFAERASETAAARAK